MTENRNTNRWIQCNIHNMRKSHGTVSPYSYDTSKCFTCGNDPIVFGWMTGEV